LYWVACPPRFPPGTDAVLTRQSHAPVPERPEVPDPGALTFSWSRVTGHRLLLSRWPFVQWQDIRLWI